MDHSVEEVTDVVRVLLSVEETGLCLMDWLWVVDKALIFHLVRLFCVLRSV